MLLVFSILIEQREASVPVVFTGAFVYFLLELFVACGSCSSGARVNVVGSSAGCSGCISEDRACAT